MLFLKCKEVKTMKKYIILLFVLLTVLVSITACSNNKQAYCKNCDNEVTVNEAIDVDSLPKCDECGCRKVYYK